jgi:subtilisin family serine protease
MAGYFTGHFIGLCCAVSLLHAAAAPLSPDFPTRWQLREAGQVREFDLALDELHRRGTSETPHRFARRTRGRDLLEHAEALRQATREELNLVLYPRGAPRNDATRRVLTRQVLVQLEPGFDALWLARRAGVACRPAAPFAARWCVLEAPQTEGALTLADTLRALPGVARCEPQLARLRQHKLIPNDPRFGEQWHLLNNGQGGALPGIDLNVTPVWDSYQGDGVVVGIVDDSLQYTHPDLSANAILPWGHDFNDFDTDPRPDGDFNRHGTKVAGLVAARGHNSIGVCGTAPRAGLVGLRLIAQPTTDAQEAAAMSHSNDVIHVKNNSWGAYDGTGMLEGPGSLTQAALEDGVNRGRNGRGTLYVFAGGNGRESDDNANTDGYANSMYTIAVGAISDRGTQALYSEPGACLVVVAPSGSNGRQRVTTTDLVGTGGDDVGDYTSRFSGTSASTPMVSGVVALMLQANPRLGWRDVQEILMRSARVVDATDRDWTTNRGGFHFNHKYGSGLVNATGAVALAKDWVNLGPRKSLSMTRKNLSLTIPDFSTNGVEVTFNFANSPLRVEHATLTVDLIHYWRADLTITLVSPDGTSSRLYELNSQGGSHFLEWTLMSVRHWGESSLGTWKVRITDGRLGQTGTLNGLRLDLYGANPLPPAPTLAVSALNGSVVVRLTGTAGRVYAIDGAFNLPPVSGDTTGWRELMRAVANNGVLTYTEPLGGPNRFFRGRLIQ